VFSSGDRPTAQDPVASTAGQESLVSSAPQAVVVPDTAARDAQVRRLLREAHEHMKAGRTTEPAKRNAWEMFGRVLEIDPGNEEATAGQARILDRYIYRARDSQRARLWSRALWNINTALKVAPDNRELLLLKQEVLQQQLFEHDKYVVAEQPHQIVEKKQPAAPVDPVRELLDQAQAQLAAYRLTRPRGDNAYETYARVLKEAPGNQEARRGIQRIAERYNQLARQNYKQGKLEKATTFITDGLAIMPRHSGLLALQKEITREHTTDKYQSFESGERFYYGRNSQQDYKKAAQAYQLAAEQGHPGAMYSLGVCYARGQGVLKDARKAAAWFQKAAEQGVVLAYYHLGLAYYTGYGVAQNSSRAFNWFQRAAQQGYVKAYEKLGWMYQKGLGVAKDGRASVRWFWKSDKEKLDKFFGSGDDADAAEEVKTVPEWEFKVDRQGGADPEA
jgi:TPR repeat protein